MTRIGTNKSVLALTFAGLAMLPAGTAFAAAHHTTTTSEARTFKGPTEETRYGPVQVSIVAKNKKISAVHVINSPESGRSMLIESQAIPILNRETLRAQSAKIDGVSGATDTTEGYLVSLQAAVNAARKAKALK